MNERIKVWLLWLVFLLIGYAWFPALRILIDYTFAPQINTAFFGMDVFCEAIS